MLLSQYLLQSPANSPRCLRCHVCSGLTMVARRCVHVVSPVLLKEPAERFEAEQQATGHLIDLRPPDHMLIYCHDVA